MVQAIEMEVQRQLLRCSMFSKALLLSLLTLLIAAPAAVRAQSPERYELRLQLRHPDGAPAAGVRVALYAIVPDGLPEPMGERISDEAGQCAWLLAPHREYELLFPDHQVSRSTLAEAGHSGYRSLAAMMGEQDARINLALADASGRERGQVVFMDSAPAALSPQPIVPELEPGSILILAGAVVTPTPLPAIAPVATHPEPAAAPVSSEENGRQPYFYLWALCLAAFMAVVAVWYSRRRARTGLP
jgi:hypothetical protein